MSLQRSAGGLVSQSRLGWQRYPANVYTAAKPIPRQFQMIGLQTRGFSSNRVSFDAAQFSVDCFCGVEKVSSEMDVSSRARKRIVWDDCLVVARKPQYFRGKHQV